MSTSAFVILSISVLIAAFIQGSLGFGFALLLAPVIGLTSAGLLPVVLLELLIPLNAYVACRERHAIDLRGTALTTAGRAVGAVGGLWLLVAVSAGRLHLLVGCATVIAVLTTLVAPVFVPNKSAYLIAGGLSGIAETATGIGGPPLAIIYQHRSPAVMRATVAVCGLVGEMISLAVLAVSGNVDGHLLLAGLMLLPAMAVGALLSNISHHRIRGSWARIMVLAFAATSGMVLIAQS